MARLPKLLACILAEQVRPEVGGRSTILGYAGICPDVQIQAETLPGLTNLCAFVQLSRVEDEHGLPHVFVEVHGPEGLVLPRTPVPKPNIVVGKNAVIALNFQGFPLTKEGKYSVVLFNDDEIHSTHFFTVSGPLAN